MRWDDVRLFLTLMRASTLGEAAKQLGVDQSTVSRRLAMLEETLDASLFDRGRNGVTATAAAESLVPVAEEIEHAMARFTGAVESLERDVAGVVRIACPADAAEVMIVPRLPGLLARYPGLRVEILAGEQVVDVARRAADIGVRVVRPRSGDLIVRKLPTLSWVLAATPALADVLGELRTWRDVPWVTFGEALAHIPAARWVGEHAESQPVVRSDSLRVQIAVVASGLGAALIPAPSVAHYGLAPVRVSRSLRRKSRPLPEDDLLLVTHRALRTVPRVQAVWEFLVAAAG